MPSKDPEVWKKWRSENKDKLDAIASRYRENNKEALRIRGKKRRDKRVEETGYSCNEEYQRAYREERRELLKEQAKRYRRESPARLVSAAKIRAKTKNLPFDITVDDIVIPEYCPVLGIPLVVGDGKKHYGSPSLDKFTPELGYVKGNVFVISDRANTLKSDGTIEELEKILEYMKNGKA